MSENMVGWNLHGFSSAFVEALIDKENPERNPKERSSADAVGLTMVLPSTAVKPGYERYGPVRSIASTEAEAERLLEDPQTNVEFGLAYLRTQVNRLGSIEKALNFYSGGHKGYAFVVPRLKSSGRK